MFARMLFPFLCLALPVKACELALLLAIDVSGSVDRSEYRIQMDGLAAALQDGIVSEALVSQQAYVSLLQWTGSSRQRMTLPWTQMRSFEDIDAFAQKVSDDLRIWRNYSTAIGEALVTAREAFEAVPQCRRRVIDVSGDGISNEGAAPEAQRRELTIAGITVNALAIETDEVDLTAYFFENVINGEDAFVMTADGFEDYPPKIKRKLQRETTKQVSQSSETAPP